MDDIKYLNTKQEIIEYLNKKFIIDAEDTTKTKLTHLFSFLYPDDSKKDEKFMIYRIATYFSMALNMSFNSDKDKIDSKSLKDTQPVKNNDSIFMMKSRDMSLEDSSCNYMANGCYCDQLMCVGCGAFLHDECHRQESSIKDYCSKQCYQTDYNLAMFSARGFLQVNN